MGLLSVAQSARTFSKSIHVRSLYNLHQAGCYGLISTRTAGCGLQVRGFRGNVLPPKAVEKPEDFLPEEIPSNLKIMDPRVFDDMEEKEETFKYIIPAGPKLVPYFKLSMTDFTIERQESDFELNNNVFSQAVRPDIIAQVVRWQLAKRRAGTAKVKNISERSGTGRKPFPQKGTGMARRATNRAPHHRKGGRVHGPTPEKNYAFQLNKKIRRNGLRSVLTARLIEKNITVVDGLDEAPCWGIDPMDTVIKRFHIRDMIENCPLWGKKVLFVTCNDSSLGFREAQLHLDQSLCLPERGLNVYDVMQFSSVVFSPKALEELTDRLDEGRRKELKRFN
mmetsp:Transcript_9284/g.15088  ORF Transcript_9284/g.15088 Transcript_9284/m.15088 type:complete len:336 (-) Transcript_9284:1631-2638(-)